MLVTQKRPRVLKWQLAAPLLYGDWGTSRLYVLGLAFFFTAHASLFYLVSIGALMACVAWAYTIVCRSYPDGGGVYTAARDINKTLSVIGATLLLCGYIMTAAISVVEALHYIGVGHGWTLPGSILLILVLGLVNWFGAKAAGRLALYIAFAALAASAVIVVLAVPHVPAGLHNAADSFFTPFDDIGASWVYFTKLCLALAGVEAVANMTGLMKEPVERTSKFTLLPVLGEVVLLNLFFGIAFLGLSAFADATVPMSQQDPLTEEARAVRDTAMKVLATEAGGDMFGASAGFWIGKVCAVVFALLLLSATNTAVMAMVSVMFSMGQDRELPRGLTKLNYSGVPWVGLIVACVVPCVILLITVDVLTLAKLYILGVAGAITVNVLCCAANKKLQISALERSGLAALGVFLLGVSVTIAVTQLEALVFAGTTVGAVLLVRQGLSLYRKGGAVEEELEQEEIDWLAELRKSPAQIDPSRPRIMLAARGRYQAEFAVDLARRRKATLFAIFVRTLRVMDVTPGRIPKIQDDPDAIEALGTTARLARRYGVPFFPIYVTSSEIAEEILDYTVTYGCDTLILGKTRRRAFARALEGDVVVNIAEHLPGEVALITREATPHPMGPPPELVAGSENEAREAAREHDKRDGG